MDGAGREGDNAIADTGLLDDRPVQVGDEVRGLGGLLDEHVTHFFTLPQDFHPVRRVEFFQCCGEQDILLFEDHTADFLDERVEGLLAERFQFLRRRVLEPGDSRFQQVSYLVVLAPHHLGRAGEILFLQEREQQLLLALVVGVDAAEHRQQRRQAALVLGSFQRFEQLLNLPVFLLEEVDRVRGRGLRHLHVLQC